MNGYPNHAYRDVDRKIDIARLKERSLKAKIALFTFLPMCILSLVLLGLFFYYRPGQLDTQMQKDAQQLASSLTIALEYAIKEDSRESVRQIISQAHKENSNRVRTIAVFDKENRIYASSVFHPNIQSLAYSSGMNGGAAPLFYEGDSIMKSKPSLFIVRRPIFPLDENVSFKEAKKEGMLKNAAFYVSLEIDPSQTKVDFYQETFFISILVLFSLLLNAYFSFALIRYIIEPLNSMISAVEHIRRGYLDVRITSNFSGELTLLKNGINEMASTLSDYHIEMQSSIEQATSDLRETLEQLEIQNIELDLAKKQAQEAARVKSEFLTNISHELRTPLNGVLGFTKQLLKTPLNYSQKDYMLTIEQAALNLLHIVNDVLDFSKLDAKKLELEHSPFYLRDLVNTQIQLLSQAAYQKELDLDVDIDDSVEDYCIGDSLRIGQVLTNLISNAIKFTEKGRVSLYVALQSETSRNKEVNRHPFSHPRQQTLIFRIQDTGIGIPIEQQKRLFQAFQQADSSISRQYGGTGLGLVISKQLIDQMYGHIGFDSTLNSGTTFYFTLPLIMATEPVIEGAPFEKKRVAIVDTHQTQRENSKQILQRSGANVVTYSTLDQILLDEGVRYDYLFLNLSYQQAQSSSQLTRAYTQTKVIATTTIIGLPSNQLALVELLSRIGFDYYMTLPLLRERLNNLFKTTQLTQKRYFMHVLAVDDNKANLKLISALLDDVVLYVASASSGKKAIEFANKQAFDLIFMDIQMPEMDGMQTRDAIEKTDLNAGVPVIAVTANAIPGTKERLIADGFSDYLSKPIDELALLELIQRWGPNTLFTEQDDKEEREKNKEIQSNTDALKQISESPSFSITETDLIHFDPTLALRQSAGKRDLAQELLQLLLKQCVEVKEQIEQSLAQCATLLKESRTDRIKEETDYLSAQIHKLNGGCSYCGAVAMQKLCALIESELLTQTIIELEPELLELQDELTHFQEITDGFSFI